VINSSGTATAFGRSASTPGALAGSPIRTIMRAAHGDGDFHDLFRNGRIATRDGGFLRG
jgi:hypothetical protein